MRSTTRSLQGYLPKNQTTEILKDKPSAPENELLLPSTPVDDRFDQGKEMDEPENVKFGRTLCWGEIRAAIGHNFEKAKHFVWLEKGGYDVGILLVSGVRPTNIVAVSEDPDLAMEVQNRFTDVPVICGDPLELVRKQGRIFTGMCFGYHRPFSKEYFEQILSFLQHGAKDDTFFHFSLNAGHPDGEALLTDGRAAIRNTMKEVLAGDLFTVINDRYLTAGSEERAKIKQRTTTPEGTSIAEKEYREDLENSLRIADDAGMSPDYRAPGRFWDFVKYFRDRSVDKRFGPVPFRVQILERRGQEEHNLLISMKVLRAKPGEKIIRFAERFRDVAADALKCDISLRRDQIGLIRGFYEGNKAAWEKHPEWFWELYFGMEPKLTAKYVIVTDEVI